MVIKLLLTLLVITVSGVALDAAENRAGPLAATRLFLYRDQIIDLHVVSTNVGLGLVALHLLGVLHASIAHRENLVRALITGRKRPLDQTR
jgi:cytochrome b